MPASRYKVFHVGAAKPGSATAPLHVAIQAMAKTNGAVPNVVVNEFICNQIAKCLVLPSPPGAIVEISGTPYFVSLDFNLAGQALPPITPAQVVSEQPELSWGIILFDVLIMNRDRHAQNLSYDTTTKRLQVFDHSHALLGAETNIGAFVSANENVFGANGHILIPEIVSPIGQTDWVGRIKCIPNYFLEDVVRHAVELGFPSGETATFADFLKQRRDRIDDLLRDNLTQFSKLAGKGV